MPWYGLLFTVVWTLIYTWYGLDLIYHQSESEILNSRGKNNNIPKATARLIQLVAHRSFVREVVPTLRVLKQTEEKVR
jgi:hypothetical protein